MKVIDLHTHTHTLYCVIYIIYTYIYIYTETILMLVLCFCRLSLFVRLCPIVSQCLISPFSFPFLGWSVCLPEDLVSLCLALDPFLFPFLGWHVRIADALSHPCLQSSWKVCPLSPCRCCPPACLQVSFCRCPRMVYPKGKRTSHGANPTA